MVDEPTKGILYGSTVAAPYIAKTLETVLPYLGVEPVYTEEEKSLLEKQIPDYVGLPVVSARAYAESRGLEVEVIGGGAYVCTQTPKSGSLYSCDGRIVFYTGDSTENVSEIPDVIGKSISEASKIITGAGFNIKLKGATQSFGGAVAVSQSVAAGTRAPVGIVVTVEMRTKDAD